MKVFLLAANIKYKFYVYDYLGKWLLCLCYVALYLNIKYSLRYKWMQSLHIQLGSIILS